MAEVTLTFRDTDNGGTGYSIVSDPAFPSTELIDLAHVDKTRAQVLALRAFDYVEGIFGNPLKRERRGARGLSVNELNKLAGDAEAEALRLRGLAKDKEQPDRTRKSFFEKLRERDKLQFEAQKREQVRKAQAALAAKHQETKIGSTAFRWAVQFNAIAMIFGWAVLLTAITTIIGLVAYVIWTGLCPMR